MKGVWISLMGSRMGNIDVLNTFLCCYLRSLFTYRRPVAIHFVYRQRACERPYYSLHNFLCKY